MCVCVGIYVSKFTYYILVFAQITFHQKINSHDGMKIHNEVIYLAPTTTPKI